MARQSSLAHPTRGRYVVVHHWILEAAPAGIKLGFAGALVLETFCFWDRYNDEPESWLGKSRMDLRDHLVGYLGKDLVKTALDKLIEIGWIEEKKVTTNRSGGGWDTKSDLRLMSSVVNLWLAKNINNYCESKHGDFQPFGMTEISNQAGRISANGKGDFQPVYIEKEEVVLNKTTTTTTADLDVCDLKKLPAPTVVEIVKLVKDQEDAQLLIYLLAAALAKGQSIAQPLLWLKAILKHDKPDFTAAHQFAERKRNAAAIAARGGAQADLAGAGAGVTEKG